MSHETSVQPSLADLMASYLKRQTDAQDAGVGAYDGEVTPYEVGPVQPLDPKLAWDEALTALNFYTTKPANKHKAPPHFAQLVGGHESILAIAFSVGNFPQLMRNFHDILLQRNLTDVRPAAGRPASVATELTPWIAQQRDFPQMLLAVGALRLAKDFAAADQFVQTHDADVPADWRPGWENEKAALAWHSGRYDDARQIWAGLEATTPVLFNRGMAALFAGEIDDAKPALAAACAALPASSAWHHLGRLYLTLADLRR